ncbi:cytochrome P450 [Ilumatobacter nonamiensis]|uniref:cytochrome P450 n=1 Tax=Ilumatobacter nonamiensis TaxID=467093 RepID=UPI00058E5012|nr:cytochrome P450 [Ilumatobacter nonamiensis]
MSDVTALFARQQDALRCPYPIFDDLRDDAPLVWDDGLGAWIATTYRATRAILRDTANWSSKSPTSPGPRESAMTEAMATLSQEPAMADAFEKMLSGRRTAAVLLNADPPDHVRQRRVVNAAFRPDRIRALEPTVRQRSDELIGSFVERGSVEFVSEYAVLLPMRIIADALGVGDDDLLMFKQWSDDLVIPIGNASPSVDQVRDFITSTRDFADYFSEKLERRTREPQDDLLSDVANAELDGERLTHAEQISMCQQFLVAGNETTTKLIANMANRFASEEGLQDSIAADRELIPPFVEESLRFEAPVQGLFRQAKNDVTVDGVTVSAGEHVWIVYAAANRDEDKFECPAEFDPARSNAREHLSFGNGEHFCIGAGLARAEAQVAVEAMLEHLPNLRFAELHEPAYEDSFILRGLKTLHLDFG